MFELTPYTPDRQAAWDDFVSRSREATFLHRRGYMDYHAERFTDCSLMAWKHGRLWALVPGNRVGDTWQSHGGLTYGGLLTTPRATAVEVCELFRDVNAWLRAAGVRRAEYKPVPWIYCAMPSEEALYALTNVCGARLSARAISSAIQTGRLPRTHDIRRQGARKAREAGIVIAESRDWAAYWQLLTDTLLTAHGIAPVHTLAEIELLASRFPGNIRLVTATLDGEMLAGTVLYVTGRVVHTQYIAASPEGKRLHALDFLMLTIIPEALERRAFFDFGISTEQRGRYLNTGLIHQKEGFGGRGVCYDTYEWDL